MKNSAFLEILFPFFSCFYFPPPLSVDAQHHPVTAALLVYFKWLDGNHTAFDNFTMENPNNLLTICTFSPQRPFKITFSSTFDMCLLRQRGAFIVGARLWPEAYIALHKECTDSGSSVDCVRWIRKGFTLRPFLAFRICSEKFDLVSDGNSGCMEAFGCSKFLQHSSDSGTNHSNLKHLKFCRQFVSVDIGLGSKILFKAANQ